MKIIQHKKLYAFEGNSFTVDGVDFQLTGVSVDEFGNTIDHVKNVNTGKHGYVERMSLVRILMGAGYEKIIFGK